MKENYLSAVPVGQILQRNLLISLFSAPQDYFYFRVTVKGLTGGHSGDDINKGRANANKLLNRFLTQLASKYILYLCEIDGGNLHNAIPREAQALLCGTYEG